MAQLLDINHVVGINRHWNVTELHRNVDKYFLCLPISFSNQDLNYS